MSARADEAEPANPERDAFWDGFANPSLASCIGALLFAITELALACWWVKPARIAEVPITMLKQSEGDEYCGLSLRLLRYHLAPLRGLQVSYLGASTATQSLATREPGALSNILSQKLGRRVRFHRFSSNGQRYEDALAVGDQLPPGYQGVFVLVVNDYKNDDRELDVAVGKPRGVKFFERILVDESPARDALWEEDGYVPRRTGVFFLDHLDFFAARRVIAIRLPTRPDAHDNPRVTALRSLLAARAAEGRERGERRNLYDPPILGANRRAIEKLVDLLAEREIPLIFVEAPLNPRRAALTDPRILRYYSEMTAFAEAHGAAYWNWNAELDFQPSDFRDQIHLGQPDARRRFQKRLTDGVVEVLKRRYDAVPLDGDDSSDGEDEDGDG